MAIALLVPIHHFLFNLTTTLHPQVATAPLTGKERDNWMRIVGFAPVDPLTGPWWVRLSLVVALCSIGTWALVAAYGSWSAISQDVNRLLATPDGWFAIGGMFIGTFLVYGPVRMVSGRYMAYLGLNVARPWKVLAASLALWMWVAALFAGMHQKIDVLCGEHRGALCGMQHAYSQPLTSSLDAIYFSAVTLATVGYGDISPVAPVARLVTVLEIAIGIGLLGFLLGRVAGLAVATDRNV
ncbi:ion channel [Noviherbaspirillum sp. CPCC 100848]|uniref:Ion channel n=1 Tax=Noviherbaspirillum album TaxID=3080276 RepID=A0ABU6JA39_9BURK|nr:ion channel [Noviherbaspirillum sp. CPCC 100848]MEC4720515.1 ion channel [Noviherbaspirillum sp. CPCC 100848]